MTGHSSKLRNQQRNIKRYKQQREVRLGVINDEAYEKIALKGAQKSQQSHQTRDAQ